MSTHLQPLNFENSVLFAAELDARDSLKNLRERFYIPKQSNGEDVIYFTDNSFEVPHNSKFHLFAENGELFTVKIRNSAKNEITELTRNRFGVQ